MFLSELKAINFKNYDHADVKFDHKVNIIFGNNGSGKTNILDAIHFLSVSKSYFGLSDKYLVKEGTTFYRLEGIYNKEEKTDHLIFKYKLDQNRNIQLNLKKMGRVRDLLGKFPIVLIAPDDINIVKGSSRDRRDYFNKWMCQSDPEYLEKLMSYNRILRQKDAILKSDHTPGPLVIEALNHQLIPLAGYLHQSLKRALTKFIPLTINNYDDISDQNEEISINYKSDLNEGSIVELFSRICSSEISAKRPLVGPQKDEYEFEIGNKPLKKFGSQGQIKSFLYSLRLAEFEFLRTELNCLPILALDDFFEKLDNRRLAALLSLIDNGKFGQLFLTDTELERTQKILESRGIKFGGYHVEEGKIKRVH